MKNKEAVEKLRANKEICSEFNVFGDSNHESIDIMIDIIENKRTEDYVYSNYPSCDESGKSDMIAHRKWQSAMIGVEFLRGEHKIEDLLYPV